MKLIEIFTYSFIIWEIIKLIMAKKMWEQTKIIWHNSKKIEPFVKKNENPLIRYIGFIYIIYVILMLFTPFVWIIIGILGLSIISLIILLPYIKNDSPLDPKIFSVLFLDCLLTIFLLGTIIFNYGN